MANPLVCIFNPITTLIDQVQSYSAQASPPASAAGAPVVLNSLGLIDPSFLGEGIDATAGELLVAGALVNLYNNGGSRYMQNAYAAAVGTAPSGHAYPVDAVGFVANNTSISNSSLVLFTGTFTYADPNSEFTANSIGKEVYLRATPPAGGVTLTAPSGAGQITQSVGNVVGFTAPNFVLISYVASPQPPFSTPGGSPTQVQFNKGGGVFGGIPGSTADGTNGLLALAPTGTGVGLTVTGDASSSDILDLTPFGGSSPAFTFSADNNSDAIFGINDGTGNDHLTLFVGGSEVNVALHDQAGDQIAINTSTGTSIVTLQDSSSSSPNISLQTTSGIPHIVLKNQASSFKSFIGQGAGLTNPTTFNLPPTDGTLGYVLQTDGAGNTSWVASGGGGGTPAAPFTSVQFNNSGAFGGSSSFVWDTTNTVSAFAPALAIGNSIGAAQIPNSRIAVMDNFTTTTPAVYSAYQFNTTINGTGDFTGTAYIGYEATMVTTGTANYGSVSIIEGAYQHEAAGGTIDTIIGMNMSVGSNAGTGDCVTMYGVQAGVAAGANVTSTLEAGNFVTSLTGGTALLAAGIESQLQVTAPGVVTTGYGVKVDGPFSTGTITTYYGVYCGAPAATVPVTFWSFYAVEGASFFGDPVTITPTNTGVALTASGDAFSSDILDLHANDTTLIYSVNNFGSVHISPKTGDPTFPALTVQGQSNNTAVFYGQSGGTLTVDTNAKVILAPSVGGAATLQVQDDGGGT